MIKRVAPGTLLLAGALAIVPSARATSVSGQLTIAGPNSYTLDSISFPATPPSFVFEASDSLGTATPVGTTVSLNDIDFATAAGQELFNFNSGTVVMTINTWNILQDTAMGLNIHGLATMSQTGFNSSPYDFTLKSTTVSSSTTYALDLAPAPEPGTLFLVGIGLLGLAGLLFHRARSTDRKGEH